MNVFRNMFTVLAYNKHVTSYNKHYLCTMISANYDLVYKFRFLRKISVTIVNIKQIFYIAEHFTNHFILNKIFASL